MVIEEHFDMQHGSLPIPRGLARETFESHALRRLATTTPHPDHPTHSPHPSLDHDILDAYDMERKPSISSVSTDSCGGPSTFTPSKSRSTSPTDIADWRTTDCKRSLSPPSTGCNGRHHPYPSAKGKAPRQKVADRYISWSKVSSDHRSCTVT
ncbi:hypothetical protein CC86DRAFT_376764 [Ophiobolus disseminans]|uniref:Uncharacterized protein n=1 Tax=Ophiobolus disseminans TaxID=1469910 RepID=A0A6A7ALN1_9PLEO|nr:hypothetical protein CC86DRAFT_376764 [Ophiobolus disseminans]